ncbi:MAG: iron ABC transporter permease [Anditalea sp.]
MEIAKLNYYWWNKWTGLAILIVLLVSIPIFTLFFNIFEPPGNSWGHLKENLLFDYFKDTLLLLFGVAFFTFLLGVSTAWVISSYNFPGRRYFEWLLILPLGFPGYIMAYAYTGLLDYSGPIQTFLRNSLNISVNGGLVDIMNLPGAIFILSITLFPYVFLISRSSFLQQSKTLQEASALLGSNHIRTFFRIALPMARPAIVGGIALASMEVLNDYGVVKYFGVSTFTTGIFRAWFSMGDASTAIYLAAILMLFVFVILFLENFQRGNRRYVPTNSLTKPIERNNLPLGKQYYLTGICIFIFLISFFVPLMQILYWVSLTYHKVINWDFFILIFRSFFLAICTGAAIVVLSIILLYALRLNPFKWLKNITRIATLGYAVPGAVIAVGIMIPLLGLDKWLINQFPADSIGLIFSGTLFALVFAYIVRFMAVGYNPIDAGFQKIGLHVNEASRLLGRGTGKTLLKIDLPLIKSSLFTGILLVFVDVLKELPLTLILRPFNFHTLATKAFDMATNEMIAESANAALIIILTGIIPIIFLNRLIRIKEV